MKYYLGIDIGKYVHEAILCDENGSPVGDSLRFKATYEGYQQLFAYVEKSAGVNQFAAVHAGMEATGSYWLSLYEQLHKLGMLVTVLNPLQVRYSCTSTTNQTENRFSKDDFIIKTESYCHL